MSGQGTQPAAGRAALLPDVVTSIGLLAGCFSLVFSIGGHFERAGWMIGASMVFDICDGLAARVTGRSSRFGLEYDSLSDVITFGVAPAILADAWALRPLGDWAVLIVATYVICAALRLARFNIEADNPHGKRRFVGLPVPGAAIAIAGVVFGYRYFSLDVPRARCVFMAMFMPALAALMVSRVPYPSAKVTNLRALADPRVVASAIVIVAALLTVPRLAVFVGGIGYLLSGPLMRARGEQVAAGPEPS